MCVGLSVETVDTLMDYVEKYLMVRLYRFTFCSYLTDDEEQDLAMQTRIRSLHWITSHLLDTALDESCDDVRDLLDDAITGQLLVIVIHCVSTVSSPFYFCDNFPQCKPIQIIFGRNIADKIWNKWTHGNFDIYSSCIASLLN